MPTRSKAATTSATGKSRERSGTDVSAGGGVGGCSGLVSGSGTAAGPGARTAGIVPTVVLDTRSRSASLACVMSQRVAGSGSIRCPIGSWSRPARTGRGTGVVAITCNIANGFGRRGCGGRPSTAAYSVAPSAQASAAVEGSAPRASSGEKYAGVPLVIPVCVSRSSWAGWAMPKSLILARSSSATRMLAGLTSRWMIPAACAAARAAATWAPILATRSAGSGPWAISSDKVWDRKYSMTNQGTPSCSTTS